MGGKYILFIIYSFMGIDTCYENHVFIQLAEREVVHMKWILTVIYHFCIFSQIDFCIDFSLEDYQNVFPLQFEGDFILIGLDY